MIECSFECLALGVGGFDVVRLINYVAAIKFLARSLPIRGDLARERVHGRAARVHALVLRRAREVANVQRDRSMSERAGVARVRRRHRALSDPCL
jgi:hypothetical protein